MNPSMEQVPLTSQIQEMTPEEWSTGKLEKEGRVLEKSSLKRKWKTEQEIKREEL